MPMEPERFVFNGLDAATGDYLWPEMTAQQIVALACGKDPDAVASESAMHHRTFKGFAPLDADPKKLEECGWGVVFASDEDPKVREALQPLLEHRRAQATSIDERRFRIYEGADGYRPSERKMAFLERHNAPTSGPAEPDRMPYYLLLVGSPQKIPCELQAHFGIQYAVGRLHFDTPEEYGNYARSVVACERGAVPVARRMSLFGVRNPNDSATARSSDGLIGGLEDYLRSKAPSWSLDVQRGEQATKAELARRLGGPETPAVLLTASHGVGYRRGDRRQYTHQGALVCQDWPGRRSGRISPDMCFGGEDLDDSARLAGLIAFFFACYSGGTPKLDAYGGAEPKRIADRAFFARLPLRMLGHPHGGALATVAHVDRAWGCSFSSSKGTPQIAVFKSFAKRLLDGHTVGWALEAFGTRHGELSSELLESMEMLEHGDPDVSELEIARAWTANADARNYLILGDPAVRVPSTEHDDGARSPRVELRSVVPSVPTESAEPAVPAVPAVPAEPAPTGRAPRLAPEVEALVDQVRAIADALGVGVPLEVKTYVSRETNEIVLEGDQAKGAQLRAHTRIGLDGRAVACLMEHDGRVDEAVLQAHSTMVEHAQQTRLELVRLILEHLGRRSDRTE